MAKTYARTIQQSSGKVSEANYNRILNRIEGELDVKIAHRCFEIGGIAKRLHVHATITQSSPHSSVLTHKMVENILQKNQKRNFCFKEIFDPAGWYAYIEKDQEREDPDPPTLKCYCFLNFDVRKFSCGILRKV